MALTITMKQHDTRPVQQIGLLEPDPADITTTQEVDLTSATSAKLLAKAQAGADTFTSTLGFGSPRTGGTLVYTPIAADTAVAGVYQAEVEITWSSPSGVETFPNDTYFTINVVADLG